MSSNNGKTSTTGYFDLQVNGYAGVDFNSDHLTAESLHRACASLQRDGVAGILATVITDDVDVMAARLRRLVELRAADPCVQRVIWGLHVEGPFINPDPGFAGAHPVDAVRLADLATMRTLLDAGSDLVRLVTLAPEADPDLAVTQFLHEAGIVVAAGHSDATVAQLDAAIDAGLKLFTHLGNGCPVSLPRHDNIVQRVLSVARRRPLWVSFIADGAHVPFSALGNYLALVPTQRTIVVSDAIAAAGLGPGRYSLGRHTVRIGKDRVARAADGSHLVGSATPLKTMAAHLGTAAGLTADQVARLMKTNPRRLMKMEGPVDPTAGGARQKQKSGAGNPCFDPEASVLRTPRS